MSERLERLRALLSRLKKPKKINLFLKTENDGMYRIEDNFITPITDQELAESDELKIFVSFPTVDEYLEFTDRRLNLN
ncbi:MAG: hypothetical protein WDA08_04600 [Weeksellaceae bacterium]|nr:hypothetical protein [Acholeplasmataceae bacterium]